MTFEYVSVEQAIARDGLRMVVVGHVPSPWGEAAKGILHIKGIEWVAVRLDYENEALRKWVRRLDGPVAVYGTEKPRAGWSDILFLAERLEPSPSLLPEDPTERALMFGLAHELCGEHGLGWSRRLHLVHLGLQKAGGFWPQAAEYLARKYGYSPEAGEQAGARSVALLGMLAARLHKQNEAGRAFFIGDRMTPLDVYSATFMALFSPLPPDQCAMRDATRAAFETSDAQTAAALDPVLLAHRDMMYSRYLELPLSL